MEFGRRPLALPGPAKRKEIFGFLVESNLCWRSILLQRTITIQIIQSKQCPPHPLHSQFLWRESKNGTQIKSTCVFNTCDNHFLHFSFCPLKVGTPLSALTPAPVMTAMCLALEKSSRNSSISGKQNQHAELRRGHKRGFSYCGLTVRRNSLTRLWASPDVTH